MRYLLVVLLIAGCAECVVRVLPPDGVCSAFVVPVRERVHRRGVLGGVR
ncbi:hypothetical protein GOV07_01960 [Candidatus Woesearchaeota archaeon]|nr:hypothetical protein [Candidatus Woesearchaeota archaeon]